jgi:hypothetical protein
MMVICDDDVTVCVTKQRCRCLVDMTDQIPDPVNLYSTDYW